MKNALRGERHRNFPIPEGIIFVYVDPKTGEIVPQNFPDAQQVALKAGTELPLKEMTTFGISDGESFSRTDSIETIFEERNQD